MQKLKIMIIPFLALGLSACNTVSGKYGFFKDETQSYQKVKQLDSPVAIPQNLSSNNVQNYYEVPDSAGGNQSTNQPPLTPPGSNLQGNRAPSLSQQDKIRNAENAKIQGHTTVEQQSSRGPVSANMSFNQTWSKVGSLLQSANYKVVEKDNALGTYYVVDTRGSGGRVKKDMPIYQVHVKSAGNSVRVSVSPSNPGLQNLLARNLAH